MLEIMEESETCHYLGILSERHVVLKITEFKAQVYFGSWAGGRCWFVVCESKLNTWLVLFLVPDLY